MMIRCGLSPFLAFTWSKLAQPSHTRPTPFFLCVGSFFVRSVGDMLFRSASFWRLRAKKDARFLRSAFWTGCFLAPCHLLLKNGPDHPDWGGWRLLNFPLSHPLTILTSQTVSGQWMLRPMKLSQVVNCVVMGASPVSPMTVTKGLKLGQSMRSGLIGIFMKYGPKWNLLRWDPEGLTKKTASLNLSMLMLFLSWSQWFQLETCAPLKRGHPTESSFGRKIRIHRCSG